MILKILDDIERTKMSVIDDVKVIETIGATVLRNIFQEMVKIGLFFHKNRALKVSGHKKRLSKNGRRIFVSAHFQIFQK